MKIYRSLDELPVIPNAIVTQGTFDGVHVAHRTIIGRLKELASQHGGETVVMTFEPHPRTVLFPDDHGLKLLHTLDEKINALRAEGIQHLVVVPFTREFSRLSSMQFIRDIIVNKIGTKVLVIGYNHRFGKNREGSFEHLKQYSHTYGFAVEEIPEQDVDHVSVSSTRIRKALEQGDIKTANKYLGRPYALHGKVVHGKKLGRTIGFPTANIQVNDSLKLIPADGVYAVQLIINNNVYRGMLNSGYRPTVDGKSFAIEVHVFDFSEEIYNTEIEIRYVDKIRDEQRFEHVEALRNQLEKDKLHALQILQQSL
jgi:riboflavin kinase/FMN adenylyltransferase